MKKPLLIILVFIALTNIVGFMPLYFSALQEIKGEMKLRLSDNADLKKIAVTESEYKNPAVFIATEENEFRYMGCMYDYKTVCKTAGGFIFYAIQDNKESSLIDFVKASFGLTNEHERNGKSPLANLFKNFSKDFIGCYAKQMIFPLAHVYRFDAGSIEQTRAGHFNLLQNPPDFWS